MQRSLFHPFKVFDIRGGIKKMFFFTSAQKRGGLGQSRKKVIRKYSDFFDQRGGSHPIQKGFIRFFGIVCQNIGGL